MSDLGLALAAQGIFLTSSTTDKKSGGPPKRRHATDSLLSRSAIILSGSVSSDLAALEALEAAC